LLTGKSSGNFTPKLKLSTDFMAKKLVRATTEVSAENEAIERLLKNILCRLA
ncbi:MAG: hypothetical protein ACJA0H_001857, partial [Francisellaceae bacterium]